MRNETGTHEDAIGLGGTSSPSVISRSLTHQHPLYNFPSLLPFSDPSLLLPCPPPLLLFSDLDRSALTLRLRREWTISIGSGQLPTTDISLTARPCQLTR